MWFPKVARLVTVGFFLVAKIHALLFTFRVAVSAYFPFWNRKCGPCAAVCPWSFRPALKWAEAELDWKDLLELIQVGEQPGWAPSGLFSELTQGCCQKVVALGLKLLHISDDLLFSGGVRVILHAELLQEGSWVLLLSAEGLWHSCCFMFGALVLLSVFWGIPSFLTCAVVFAREAHVPFSSAVVWCRQLMVHICIFEMHPEKAVTEPQGCVGFMLLRSHRCMCHAHLCH